MKYRVAKMHFTKRYADFVVGYNLPSLHNYRYVGTSMSVKHLLAFNELHYQISDYQLLNRMGFSCRGIKFDLSYILSNKWRNSEMQDPNDYEIIYRNKN